MLITGQAADYMIEVLVTDMEAYQAFLLGKLTRIPGVTGVHSSFVLRKVIDRTAVPLGHLATK
jgi:Lrp/AsnC family leucine-responsive transcriptional regulator